LPNVLLTQRCVRSCPYCFARKHMAESAPEDVLSWEDLVYLADLFLAGGEKRFALLGGEPTLHPEFVDMTAYLLERGFDVTAFTSGVMSEARLEDLAEVARDLPQQRLAFVCNLNDPELTPAPPAELESVRRFLGRLGPRVVPGFNIYRPDFRLEFLFDAINEFGLQRHLRLGLSHPIPGKPNAHVSLDAIDGIVARFFGYAPLFERMRVRPGLDCGFLMCRFSDEQLGWLHRNAGGPFEFGCGPVIDIGPDMSMWPCFPLSSYRKRSVFEFDSLAAIREFYEGFHRTVRTEAGGVFEACDACRYREERRCLGGCLGHSLARFQGEARVRLPEVYP
jgi:MoaA/NifB/PqqE/SkfB family radical SAM enzyme